MRPVDFLDMRNQIKLGSDFVLNSEPTKINVCVLSESELNIFLSKAVLELDLGEIGLK